MSYVFDTSSFIVLSNYYPERFPSFWERFEQSVSDSVIVSVREVLGEIQNYNSSDYLTEWVKVNKRVFKFPSDAEIAFIREIFAERKFQNLVPPKSIIKGTPVADPFVIASARTCGGCVVTEESFKKNAAKIPNVCDHFGIDCANLEGFMEREGWTF